jgi:hypothetical protein
MTEESIESGVPKMRGIVEFPSEHMRAIGEICAFWTATEAIILQAICEILDLDRTASIYFGVNVPSGTRIEMLQAVAADFKAHGPGTAGDFGKQLLKHLEELRAVYLLRNKYAHARLRSGGPSADPTMQLISTTKRVDFSQRPLRLSEIIRDADRMHAAGTSFLSLLQENGFCKGGAWL